MGKVVGAVDEEEARALEMDEWIFWEAGEEGARRG